MSRPEALPNQAIIPGPERPGLHLPELSPIAKAYLRCLLKEDREWCEINGAKSPTDLVRLSVSENEAERLRAGSALKKLLENARLRDGVLRSAEVRQLAEWLESQALYLELYQTIGEGVDAIQSDPPYFPFLSFEVKAKMLEAKDVAGCEVKRELEELLTQVKEIPNTIHSDRDQALVQLAASALACGLFETAGRVCQRAESKKYSSIIELDYVEAVEKMGNDFRDFSRTFGNVMEYVRAVVHNNRAKSVVEDKKEAANLLCRLYSFRSLESEERGDVASYSVFDSLLHTYREYFSPEDLYKVGAAFLNRATPRFEQVDELLKSIPNGEWSGRLQLAYAQALLRNPPGGELKLLELWNRLSASLKSKGGVPMTWAEFLPFYEYYLKSDNISWGGALFNRLFAYGSESVASQMLERLIKEYLEKDDEQLLDEFFIERLESLTNDRLDKVGDIFRLVARIMFKAGKAEKVRVLAEERGKVEGAWMLGMLAELEWQNGDEETARKDFDEALRLARVLESSSSATAGESYSYQTSVVLAGLAVHQKNMGGSPEELLAEAKAKLTNIANPEQAIDARLTIAEKGCEVGWHWVTNFIEDELVEPLEGVVPSEEEGWEMDQKFLEESVALLAKNQYLDFCFRIADLLPNLGSRIKALDQCLQRLSDITDHQLDLILTYVYRMLRTLDTENPVSPALWFPIVQALERLGRLDEFVVRLQEMNVNGAVSHNGCGLLAETVNAVIRQKGVEAGRALTKKLIMKWKLLNGSDANYVRDFTGMITAEVKKILQQREKLPEEQRADPQKFIRQIKEGKFMV